jgi:hypothetical protein
VSSFNEQAEWKREKKKELVQQAKGESTASAVSQNN